MCWFKMWLRDCEVKGKSNSWEVELVVDGVEGYNWNLKFIEEEG